MAWLPDFLRNLSSSTYGMWSVPDAARGLHANGSITPGEGGIDVGAPGGTPVLAIADGPIMASGCWNDAGHCVITQRVNVPGAGPQDLYYQHIQIASGIRTGQNLKRGQVIGTVNGTVNGIAYNETELGFNSRWGGVWGTNHPGPWVADPRPWLNAILSGSGGAPPATGTAPTSASAPGGLSLDPMTILVNFWTATAAPRLKVWGEYIAIFLIAVVLIIVGFFLLNGQAATQLAKKVV